MRSKTGFPDHPALLIEEIEHPPIVHESHQVAHTLTLSEISLCLALHARSIVVIQPHLAGYPGMMTGICEYLLDISGERRSLPGIIGADKLSVGILDKADAFLGIIEPQVATITHHARITAHVIIAPRIIFEICQPEIVASQIRQRGANPDQFVLPVIINMSQGGLCLLHILTIEHSIIEEGIAIVTRQAIRRSKPEESLLVLQNIIYLVARQSILG